MDRYRAMWTTDRDRYALVYHLGSYAILHHTPTEDETIVIDDSVIRDAVLEQMLAADVVVLDDKTLRQLHVILQGRVQGVGFRAFVEREAARNGLRGWVRNLPDGGVEVTAEGTGDALMRLLTAIRQGPLSAHVRSADITWHPAHSGFTDFRVLPG